jgi:hypothetical protein
MSKKPEEMKEEPVKEEGKFPKYKVTIPSIEELNPKKDSISVKHKAKLKKICPKCNREIRGITQKTLEINYALHLKKHEVKGY